MAWVQALSATKELIESLVALESETGVKYVDPRRAPTGAKLGRSRVDDQTTQTLVLLEPQNHGCETLSRMVSIS